MNNELSPDCRNKVVADRCKPQPGVKTLEYSRGYLIMSGTVLQLLRKNWKHRGDGKCLNTDGISFIRVSWKPFNFISEFIFTGQLFPSQIHNPNFFFWKSFIMYSWIPLLATFAPQALASCAYGTHLHRRADAIEAPKFGYSAANVSLYPLTHPQHPSNSILTYSGPCQLVQPRPQGQRPLRNRLSPIPYQPVQGHIPNHLPRRPTHHNSRLPRGRRIRESRQHGRSRNRRPRRQHHPSQQDLPPKAIPLPPALRTFGQWNIHGYGNAHGSPERG